MADIFISYASEDRDRIAVIVAALEKAGWTVFWDRKTPVGMSWEQHIEQNLQQATCVLVLWSTVSVKKDWVKIEAREGLGRDCLVPVRIDPVSPPFGFGHKQFADLNGWAGDTTNPEWQELVTAVCRLAPREDPPPAPPAPDPLDVPSLDLSAYWQRLLKNPSASQLEQLADEVQALREGQPAEPDLIKLQRRVAQALMSAEPEKTPLRAQTSAGKLIFWIVIFMLIFVAAGTVVNKYSLHLLFLPGSREPPAVTEPAVETTSDITKTGFAPELENTATSKFQLPTLVSIPSGCFLMGSPKDEAGHDDNEGPQHQVCLTGFRMGRHEVTFGQYAAFARATGRELPHDEDWGRRDRPVINVTWNDARAYVQWLSLQLQSTCGLPSEAQWEYGARARTTTRYAVPAPEGSDGITFEALANCARCGSQWDYEKTAPIGSFNPNAWGLHDMHGNVWEWVQDCWHDNYRIAPGNGTAWEPNDCRLRVLRGGSWVADTQEARSANREYLDPDKNGSAIGFRAVCADTSGSN